MENLVPDDQEVTYFSIVCENLELSSSSPLLNAGFLSRMTGAPVARNGKKLIRVQQSAAFEPGGRPSRYFSLARVYLYNFIMLW
jgi:hypothetical protein